MVRRKLSSRCQDVVPGDSILFASLYILSRSSAVRMSQLGQTLGDTPRNVPFCLRLLGQKTRTCPKRESTFRWAGVSIKGHGSDITGTSQGHWTNGQKIGTSFIRTLDKCAKVGHPLFGHLTKAEESNIYYRDIGQMCKRQMCIIRTLDKRPESDVYY